MLFPVVKLCIHRAVFIEVGIPEEGGLGQRSFQHGLIGDNSEGFESDEELDETYTPQNYTPLAAGTEGNSPPLNVNASHTTKAEHDSVFHRLLIERVTSGNNLATSGVAVQTPYTDVASPSAGEFDSAQTSGGSPIHEMFDIIDNHNLFFKTALYIDYSYNLLTEEELINYNILKQD